MKKRIISLLIGLFSFFPSQGYTYHKNDDYLNEQTIEEVKKNQEDVYVYFGYDIAGNKINLVYRGGGTILKDEDTGEFYLLTAQHLVDNTSSQLLGDVDRDVRVGDDSLEGIVVKEDVHSDLALIRLPYCTQDYFRGKIGKVNVGDFLIIWGYEGGSVRNFKTGHAGNKFKNGFIHSVPTNLGNSGSGIFAFDDLGRLVLVGVVSEYVEKQHSVSYAIGYDRIRDFLLGTGLEDEYLEEDKK